MDTRPPNTFIETIRLKPFQQPTTSSGNDDTCSWYESITKPFRMGNAKAIAYGGCTIGILTAAAHQHLQAKHLSNSEQWAIYSASGVYLRPAFITHNYVCQVTPLRSTRTFETVRVEVYQATGKQGELNSCMSGIVDFMRRSAQGRDRSILSYSVQPQLSPKKGTLQHHSQLDRYADVVERQAARGEMSAEMKTAYVKTFSAMAEYTVMKMPAEGIWGQNLWGVDKGRKTTQDHLPVPERTGYDWICSRGRLYFTESEQKAQTGVLPLSRSAISASFIAWFMDAALSFSGLSFSNRFLDDSSACASLDFSLRYHQEDVLFDALSSGDSGDEQWFLRQIKSLQASWERSYNEGVLWQDMGKDQELRAVATMTQACIVKAPVDQVAAAAPAKL